MAHLKFAGYFRRFRRNPSLATFKLRRNYSTGYHKVEVEFSNGSPLTLSTGKYARLSDGCVVGSVGDTSVLVSAVSKDKSGSSFVPLTVDYRQKSAAAGRIPTNFLRRELGPTEHEILTSRLIDRSLRPLFPPGFCNETQIVCNLLAVDGVHDPDIVGINAASAALSVSDIPWDGPVGAVRIGLLGDELIANPTRRELAHSSLNLVVVAANQNLLIMMEGCANGVPLPDFLKAVKFGVKECQRIVQLIGQLKQEAGKVKRPFEPAILDQNVYNFVNSISEPKLRLIFGDEAHDKSGRDKEIRNLKTDVLAKVKESMPLDAAAEQYCAGVFDKICKEVFRNLIFETNKRCDGRGLTDLRDISCEINLYSPLHGSALFQRGQTQVLCTVALDSVDSALKLDPVTILTSGLKEKNFFLHYEFPPYATNEIGRAGHVMRREVGHGALAERSLRPVVPNNFPFAVRLTSEVLESNGSSSMATVCGGSLALMDAGVPISCPVAGVAVGLITQYDGSDTKHLKDYRILTDILGIEDYMGDMDLKLAGTRKGITAIQADIKVCGLPSKVIMEAVQVGFDAKSQILDIMDAVISKPREERKDNWPVTETMRVEAHKRAKFAGPGGFNFKRLMFETGVHISTLDEGIYSIFAPNEAAMDEAKGKIREILEEKNEPLLEFGAIYKARIVDIRDTGVMVTLFENMTPTLLHNSQLDQRRINHASALGLKVGDEIQVKYFGRDPVSGMIRLSRKVLLSPASAVVKNLV